VIADSVSVWQRTVRHRDGHRARVRLDATRRDVLGQPLRRGEGDRPRRGHRRVGGGRRPERPRRHARTPRCSRCPNCAASRASSRC
jgi:hypothetical protein